MNDDSPGVTVAGGVDSVSSSGAGRDLRLLGFSFTAMVVPKRECREDALRATSRRLFSSAASRR